jgi:hypothetical protein
MGHDNSLNVPTGPKKEVSAFAPQPDSDAEGSKIFQSDDDDEESVHFDQAAKEQIARPESGEKVLNFWGVGGGTQSKWMMLAKDKPNASARPDSATRARQLQEEAKAEAMDDGSDLNSG